jgi:hypothetical protein
MCTSCLAMHLYQDAFPGRRILNRHTFSDIVRHRKARTFAFVEAARGRQGTVCKPELKDVAESPGTSSTTKYETGMLPIVPRRSGVIRRTSGSARPCAVCSHGNKLSVF